MSENTINWLKCETTSSECKATYGDSQTQGFNQSWLWHTTSLSAPDTQLTPPLTAQTATAITSRTVLNALYALYFITAPAPVPTLTALTALSDITAQTPVTVLTVPACLKAPSFGEAILTKYSLFFLQIQWVSYLM